MNEPHFLDTNVIVYAMGHSAGASPTTQALERACQHIVQAIGNGQFPTVTNLVVLQELVYLLARWGKPGQGPQMPNPQRVVNNVMALCKNVFTPTLTEMREALQGYDVQAHDFNDRLIVCAMRTHDVKYILSADRGFKGKEGITRVDPLSLAKKLA